MKITLKLAILAALSLSAVLAGSQSAVLVPFGIWPNCEGPTPIAVCGLGFKPGNESYALLVTIKDPEAVAYSYNVKGILQDGSERTLTGLLPVGSQAPILYFGGKLVDSVVSVDELVASPVSSRKAVR